MLPLALPFVHVFDVGVRPEEIGVEVSEQTVLVAVVA